MDDLISRKAAIDDLRGKDPSQIWDTADVEVWVNSLPSAQPERCEDCVNLSKTRLLIPQPEQKTGKWLWADGVRCSVCNHKLQSTGLPSYCPKCGVKMR